MKTIFRHFLLSIAFFVSCAVCGAAGVSGVDITVRQTSGGKTIKQTKSDASGNFVVGSLPDGAYTLEFRGKNVPNLKKQQVTISVAGTKKSGKLDKIPGEHLAAGVALKVDAAKGANVSGQISVGPRMVWIPPVLGSNRPGHWVEEDSAEAKLGKTRTNFSRDQIEKVWEKAYNPQG